MFYRIAYVVVKCYCMLFFRTVIKGTENIPKEGPVVLCANHSSNYDPVFLATSVRRPLYFMAKKELFQIKGLSWIIRHLHAFPVDRNISDMNAFKTAIRILESGKIVGIFAQGTRVKPGEEKTAKSGVALIALKGKAPILPVRISGKSKLFSKMSVTFAKPISLEQYYGKRIKSEQLNEITAMVMKKIDSLEN